MPINQKLSVTRNQLSKFIEDHETLIQFERLIAYMNTLVPGDSTDSAIIAQTAETKTDFLTSAMHELKKSVNDNQITAQTADSKSSYLISEVAELNKQYSNVITVAKEGGDFTTIEEALASITDNSATNRYTIDVAPGVYEVDNTSGAIQLKAFCNISAIGLRSAVLVPLDPTQDMFSGNNFTHLVGLVFSGNTGSSYIVRHEAPGSVFIQDCVLRDCSNGFLLNSLTSIFEIKVLAVNNLGVIDTINAIEITAGNAALSDITFRGASRVDVGVRVSGVNSLVNIHKLIAVSANLKIGLEIFDGARVSGVAIDILLAVDGLVIYGNNTLVEIDSSKIQECSNDGFRIDNIGTNPQLSLFAGTVTDCGGLNFNVLNTTARVLGSGYTQLNNSFIDIGADFHAYLLDITEDDEGLNIFGELHVGSPQRPVESAFGGGDSYTYGMMVYTETPAGVFVDESINARSASGSTFTYPGIAANNAIYCSSSLIGANADVLEHFGIKTKVLTAAVQGSGNIIIEYWNGVAWVEVSGMEADSGGRYFPHADNYFQDIGGHHIRYNSQLAIDSWTKNDPMSLGTSYYWTRFRIETDITTAPIFEQFKLHTNRSEINEDGWIEYFGKARPVGQLGLNFSAARPFEGAMQSQTLYINEDIGAGFTNNKFTASNDKSGVAGFLPFDFDTSSPIILEWAGHSTVTQTIEWTVRTFRVTDNGTDQYYTTEPAPIPGSKEVIVTQDIIADNVSMFRAELDIQEMISRRDGAFGDEIWISLQPSVLSGRFSITSSQATYTKWSEGGHI
jgi:hypothetical protein